MASRFLVRFPSWVALTIPTIWVVMEYVRTHLGFLSFPWAVLGYSQYEHLGVASLAAYTGVYGVSFVLVLANVLLAQVLKTAWCLRWSKDRVRPKVPAFHSPGMLGVVGGVILGVTLLAIGEWSAASHVLDEQSPSLRVGVIQGGVYHFESNDSVRKAEVLSTYKALTQKAATSDPDLIVWPSASVPGVLPFDLHLSSLLLRLSHGSHSYLLVGGSGYDTNSLVSGKQAGWTNSAFLISPQGQFVQQYHKQYLWPFGEYMPLRRYINWPGWFIPDTPDTRAGHEGTIFRLPGSSFGVRICSENLFPDVVRRLVREGAEFLVAMTNEDFFDDPAGNEQMLAMTIFRAIENNISVVRAATTGVSGLIGPTGRLLHYVHDEEGSTLGITRAVVGDIPIGGTRSWYAIHGDWWVGLCGLTLAVFGVIGYRWPSARESH